MNNQARHLKKTTHMAYGTLLKIQVLFWIIRIAFRIIRIKKCTKNTTSSIISPELILHQIELKFDM